MIGSLDLETLDLGEVVVDFDQEKIDAWHEARRGKFTCSRFGDLMTRGRGKEAWGQTALSYINQVVAEREGSFRFHSDSKPMKWGRDNEPVAVEAYAAALNVGVEYDSHNFIELTHYAGGSPDGLVGEVGCVEIKCPYDPGVHQGYLQDAMLWKRGVLTAFEAIPRAYRWQVVGHVLVTGRRWCDFVSFDPRIGSLAVIRYFRDERVNELSNRIDQAEDKVQAAIKFDGEFSMRDKVFAGLIQGVC